MTLQQALLDWGGTSRRDLPWRRTRDPWAVLVSELMLQQTQVARVAPRFGEFLERFPTPAACAGSSVGEVVRAWAGLGYNRRAVNLHRAAVTVVQRHAGQMPDDLPALLALPGVGRYTARAVLAFAFERDHGVVDTNAARVLARAAAGRRLSSLEAQAQADALLPKGDAWAWNQAVLDLGATVCTARAPACARCPVRRSCAWAARGWPAPDPAATHHRQPAFAGSDRQGRGRLLDVMRHAPVPLEDVAEAAGWAHDPARAERVVAGLVADGLATVGRSELRLP